MGSAEVPDRGHHRASVAAGGAWRSAGCAPFLEEAEEIGYTFEYGLDAEPFNFQVEDILLNKDLK